MKNQLLPAKLKELRKVHGYTQDYVASALEIVRQTYSHYETGQRTPNSETLFKLAGLYNISVDDLMQLTMDIDRNIYYDAPAPTQSSEDLASFLEYFTNPNNQKKYQMFNNLEKELLYYFEKISEPDKKEIIEFTKIKAQTEIANVIGISMSLAFCFHICRIWYATLFLDILSKESDDIT